MMIVIDDPKWIALQTLPGPDECPILNANRVMARLWWQVLKARIRQCPKARIVTALPSDRWEKFR